MTNFNHSYYQHIEAEWHNAAITLLKNRTKHINRVLEIGAGHGNNIRLLSSLGFSSDQIFLNELREDRVAFLQSTFPNTTILSGDINDLKTEIPFDLILQSTVFTSIVDPETRKKTADKIWQLLSPGGYLLWYDFIFNNPMNKAVSGVSYKTLLTLFPQAHILSFQKITLAPPIGRRVGKLYKLFNWPFLRTHILVVLRKPNLEEKHPHINILH